jgi:hypothetical protein
MEIKSYNAYNPDSKMSFNPKEVIRRNFFTINIVLKYIQQLNSQISGNYLSALQKRLADTIGDYRFNVSLSALDQIAGEFNFINVHHDLQELVALFTCKYLRLSNEFYLMEEEIQGRTLDWLRAQFILQYHRTGAFVDIMERDEGIQLWKDIIFTATTDALENKEGEIHPPIREFTEMWIQRGEEDENNTSDFTLFIFDDYKVLLKVDRCGVHEAVKHLEDQEIAFLSYCWTGFVEDKLNKRSRRRRTTQTLHLSDYCDEFYWNNDVHPDAKQPTFDELAQWIGASEG